MKRRMRKMRKIRIHRDTYRKGRRSRTIRTFWIMRGARILRSAARRKILSESLIRRKRRVELT